MEQFTIICIINLENNSNRTKSSQIQKKIVIFLNLYMCDMCKYIINYRLKDCTGNNLVFSAGGRLPQDWGCFLEWQVQVQPCEAQLKAITEAKLSPPPSVELRSWLSCRGLLAGHCWATSPSTFTGTLSNLWRSILSSTSPGSSSPASWTRRLCLCAPTSVCGRYWQVSGLISHKFYYNQCKITHGCVHARIRTHVYTHA